MFSRATIRLGICPHSSIILKFSRCLHSVFSRFGELLYLPSLPSSSWPPQKRRVSFAVNAARRNASSQRCIIMARLCRDERERVSYTANDNRHRDDTDMTARPPAKHRSCRDFKPSAVNDFFLRRNRKITAKIRHAVTKRRR